MNKEQQEKLKSVKMENVKEIKTYYDNGQLDEHYFVDTFGKKEGEYTKFYENGQLWIYGLYVNSFPEGEWETWWPDGNIASISHFEKGYRVGECKSWSTHGFVIEHKMYSRDRAPIDIL